MASKSDQEKRKLLANLEERRSSIKARAGQVEGAFKQIPQRAKGQSDKIRNITPQEVKKSSLVGKSFTKLSSLSKSQNRKRNTLISKANKITPANLPVKPIVIGLASLFAVSAIIGRGKKKKQNKKLIAQAKEYNQVAKYGFGMLILKWFLGVSQPVVKQLVTKKLKKGILG